MGRLAKLRNHQTPPSNINMKKLILLIYMTGVGGRVLVVSLWLSLEIL